MRDTHACSTMSVGNRNTARSATFLLAALTLLLSSTPASAQYADPQQQLNQIDYQLSQWYNYLTPQNLYSYCYTDATCWSYYNNSPDYMAQYDAWVAQQYAMGIPAVQELQNERSAVAYQMAQTAAQQQDYWAAKSQYPSAPGGFAAAGGGATGAAGAGTGSASSGSSLPLYDPLSSDIQLLGVHGGTAGSVQPQPVRPPSKPPTQQPQQ